MRIVGGIYKGRNLVPFAGQDIRPTSDKVRESLFNIIRVSIEGSDFLDLFCGTGAMGIEALSRGAKSVTLNDYSKESLGVVKKNLEKIGFPKNVRTTNLDALRFIEYEDKKYDFVYIDPPYKTDLGIKAIHTVSKILSKDGIAILESETPFLEELDNLIKVDERKYGRAYLTFFKLKEN